MSSIETTPTPDWALGMTAAEVDDFIAWYVADLLELELAGEPSSRDRACSSTARPSGAAAQLSRHERDEAGLAPGSA